MDVAEAGQYAVVVLSPTLLLGAGFGLSHLVGSLRRRRHASTLRPSGPPIEDLAADLRRLLLRHDLVRQSTTVAVRARHLRAIEAAIGDCAAQAAQALGLACPHPPRRRALALPDLRRLLRALADAGLVLVPAVGLLAED